jgi:Protein of unknown function (DUF429)
VEYLGIDFSGNAASWKASCTRSNVWLCRVESEGKSAPQVIELKTVQCLSGQSSPFERLAELLASKRFAAAAIDAPFSLPQRHVPADGWLELLKKVHLLDLAGNVPFPSGPALIALAKRIGELEQPKPLRLTEKCWREQRVNVRSTLWWKPRGGAPFAAACMKLLAMAKFPVCWPWTNARQGLIAEAFPAAQLQSWKLPYEKYDGPMGIEVRRQIICGLESQSRIDFGRFRPALEEYADALDAVIASFAAMAAHNGQATYPIADKSTVLLEGWIAIHP